MKRILLLVLLFPMLAFSQAVRVDIPLLTSGPNVPNPGTALPAALWLTNPTVQICAHPATLSSCSYVTTYTDSTAGTACPGTQQLTQLPAPSTCSSLAGTLGNVGFWYGGGTVDYIVTSSYGTFGPYTISGINGSGNFISSTATGQQTMAGPLLANVNYTQVPVELFGAVGDWNGTTGTDNTTAIQTAINSITSGCILFQAKSYKITSALSITHSNVGLCGIGQGYKQFTLNPGGTSTIIQATASADIVDVLGPSLASPITWNNITNIALERSVLPTGSAKGLSVKYAAGYQIRGVTSQDSIYDFWFHGAPQYVTGGIFSANAGWGGTGSLGSYTGSVYGFYLDSAGGEASGTFFADNISATNSTGSGSFTSTGIWLDGNAINDVFINQASTEATSYGGVINCTATSGFGCQDIHFTTPVFDQFKISGLQVNNLNQGAHGAATISDGWLASSSASGYGVDCESSSGLNVTNTQFQTYGGPGFHASGCQGISVNNNTFTNITGDAIDFFNTGNSSIIGNIITANASSGTAIFLGSVASSGSNNNVIVGNNMSQIAGTGANGLYFDANSQFNAALSNKFFGTYTTLITNLGASNGITQQTNTGSLIVDPATGNITDLANANVTIENRTQNTFTGTAAQASVSAVSDTVHAVLGATSSAFTSFNSRGILAFTGASELDFLFGGVNEAHLDSSGNLVTAGNITTLGNLTITGTCTGCGGSSIANIQITTGTTLIAANTCTSATNTTMTGVTTTTAIVPPTPTTDTSAVTGWGSTGGLFFTYWVTTNTFSWRVCNGTASPITPGGSITWNVGGK